MTTDVGMHRHAAGPVYGHSTSVGQCRSKATAPPFLQTPRTEEDDGVLGSGGHGDRGSGYLGHKEVHRTLTKAEDDC